MKRIVLAFSSVVWSIALVGALAGSITGCGGGSNKSDGGNGLPDGFLSKTCATIDDCSPTSCQTAKCNAVTKMCEYKDKLCTAESQCTIGACEEASGGSCVQKPANDGMTCSTMGGDPGSCISGTCTPVPTCNPSSGFLSSAECDSADGSITKDNNAPMSFGGGSPVLNAYPCAPTEAGPEIAYTLNHDPSAGDEDITISLRPVNADGTPATTDDKDLDLIILEDSCTATAACLNPAIAAGGFQGVTAGTAKERVTFRAMAGKTYYVVVDGKDMNQVRDYVLEVEACGRCQPTNATRLDCNMTVPISANTVNGAAKITDYKCGTAMTAVSAPGKEIPFYFRTADDAVRNVTATLTGATADYKLLVLPTTIWGQCDADKCIDSKAGAPAANNSITWKVDPGFRTFARYWLMVDTPTMVDTAFGLQIKCAPYCLAPYRLSCNGASDTTTVSGSTVPPSGVIQSAAYGTPATCGGQSGLNGPEVAVAFAPNIVGTKTYQLELQAKTATKDLTMVILDGGTAIGPACDPTLTCATFAATATTGSTGTLKTNIGATKTATASLTAIADHTYFIMIDGTDLSGGDFKLNIAGTSIGAHCGM